MAKGDQIHFKPHFKKEGPTLPCEGEAGDLFVFSPLGEGDPDSTQQGLASLWFCTKGAGDNSKAIWKRVQFDGMLTCATAPPKPPQNHPVLIQG